MEQMGQNLPTDEKFGFSEGSYLGNPIVVEEKDGRFCSEDNEEQGQAQKDFFTLGSHNKELAEKLGVGEGELPSYIVVKGNVGQKLFLPIKFPKGGFGCEHKKVLKKALNAIYSIFRDSGFVADVVLSEADKGKYLENVETFFTKLDPKKNKNIHPMYNEKPENELCDKLCMVDSVIAVDGINAVNASCLSFKDARKEEDGYGFPGSDLWLISNNESCTSTISIFSGKVSISEKRLNLDSVKGVVDDINKQENFSKPKPAKEEFENLLHANGEINRKSVALPSVGAGISFGTLVAAGLFVLVDYAKKTGMTEKALGGLLSILGTAGGIALLAGIGATVLGIGGFCLYKAVSNSKFNKSLKENSGLEVEQKVK